MICNVATPMATNNFDERLKKVFRLAALGRFLSAVNLIVDRGTGRLRPQFRGDANHVWYVVGDLYWRAGRFVDSLPAFRKALRSWPEDVEAMWAIGNCYAELGRPRMAERYLRRAIRFDPDRKGIRFNLGNALYDQGMFQEAIGEYRLAERGKGEIARRARKNLKLAVKLQ